MRTALKINRKRLRELRKINRYTHRHIAEELGYKHISSYQLVEGGKRSMPLKKLIVLAEFYNVSVDELILK